MRILGAALFAMGLAACTFASPTYITATQESTRDKDAGEGGASAPASTPPLACGTDDFAKPDLSTLTPCANGKGHCYDSGKVSIAAYLEPCENKVQVCVPDEVIAAGGGKLKSCTSIIGPGACTNAAMYPEIQKEGGGALKQDVCDPGLTCVPCTDPTHNNGPTPFCLPIGVHEKTCSASTISPNPPPQADAGTSTPPPGPTCCSGRGACVAQTSIEGAKADTCTGGNKCVPPSKPATCDGDIFGSGVCIDQCFSGIMPTAASLGMLHQKTCKSTELCVPCSLVYGKGVPGCS